MNETAKFCHLCDRVTRCEEKEKNKIKCLDCLCTFQDTIDRFYLERGGIK